MAALTLPTLCTKADIDHVIRETEDRVVCLRFGYNDLSQEGGGSVATLLSLDETLAKCAPLLEHMAVVYLVDVQAPEVQETYVKYFDVTLLPAVVFFFNAQHMKVDYRWVGVSVVCVRVCV